jgi:hypothetical protein
VKGALGLTIPRLSGIRGAAQGIPLVRSSSCFGLEERRVKKKKKEKKVVCLGLIGYK